MATYNKGLVSIKVKTLGNHEFTANDTVEKPTATQALAEFFHKEVMHLLNEPKVLIPFKAVEMVEVSTSVGQFDREDAYCKTGSAKACVSKTCASAVGC